MKTYGKSPITMFNESFKRIEKELRRLDNMWDFTKQEEYSFRGFYIPLRMMDGLDRYINHHIPPGDFLSAVIKNDLRGAVERADDENLTNIPAYVAFLYNEAPGGCCGSEENFKRWIKKE